MKLKGRFSETRKGPEKNEHGIGYTTGAHDNDEDVSDDAFEGCGVGWMVCLKSFQCVLAIDVCGHVDPK